MCVYVYIYIYICIHKCIHTCMHAYIHTYMMCIHEHMQVSLRCAELLNKWAASTPVYSTEIVVRSAVYAKEATDILAYMTDASAKVP